MTRARHIAVLLVVLSAGCLAGDPGTTPVEPTTEPATTATPAATPAVELASSGTQCDESLRVSFWGLSEESLWDSDTARVAYYLPANTSVLFVTYVDGEVRGVTGEGNTNGDGFNADGAQLTLDSTLSGDHVVRTVVYRDRTGDGELDRGEDAPCLDDGDVVQAGPRWVNFSRFG